MVSTIQTKTISVDGGIEVFYREAYPSDSSASSFQSTAIPVILLLHGFPTSSFQYRDLIPILAKKYRVIAPDLPGYGFTVVPEERSYKYSFESLTNTIAAFVDALQIKKFSVYVFDYGAPTGLRYSLPVSISNNRPLTVVAGVTLGLHSSVRTPSQPSSARTAMLMSRDWERRSGRMLERRGQTLHRKT